MLAAFYALANQHVLQGALSGSAPVGIVRLLDMGKIG